MKCYSLKQPGVLRKYILSSNVKHMLPLALRRKHMLCKVYLDFELFPGYSYAMFKGKTGVYGFGTSTLSATPTDHSKALPKTAVLFLYDHTRFYPDRAQGDKSQGVWLGRRYDLMVTCPCYLRLREKGTKHIWGMDEKGKLYLEIV